MVNYNIAELNTTFAALADPTRRDMINRLARHGEMTVSALAQPFRMSLPAVMKHIRVLVDAGLIRRQKRGRSVHCSLANEALLSAADWLKHYDQFWTESLDRLEVHLEDDT